MIIKGCENWVNNHKGENFLLTYSSVIELLTLLKEQEDTINELQNAYGYLQKQFFEVQDKLLKEREDEIKQLRFALNIAKGTCKGIVI